ncbi:MAG TPA: pitrilysin family protein [Thermoanaerobaculia bacterium]|nr:pitrilysin family protein [Thermoanaerobaculia bacterium]
MTKRWTLSLAAAALLALAPPALEAAALRVMPPELKVTKHQLANGLEVLLYEDHSVPVATVEVWYHVGSKDEKKGRSGFAHLFEHLMFKGSANVAAEEHKNFISSIGGRYNATTDSDRTLYWQVFPNNYLERVLWMEADRMRSLDISDENFKSEREVVKEERRLRVENPPFGRLFGVVLDKTFTTHPYRIETIGSMADLDAATLQDVRDFHSTYYVPNNATLVVSGDLSPERTIQWVEKYFGPIPQGKPIPREIAPEPAQKAERRAVDYHANTPLPAVVITYHVPQAGHPDTYALQVASNILSSGESSRLYRRMVYEKQMAVAAGGQTIALEDPGVFFFYSILQGGKPEDGEKELIAGAEELRSTPVSEADLVKAKNQLISALVFGRQTGADKADAIGYARVILGDVSYVNRQLAEFQKVTAADVQRVARTYFSPENRTVVYMLPEAMRPGAKPGGTPGQPGADAAKNDKREVKKP